MVQVKLLGNSHDVGNKVAWHNFFLNFTTPIFNIKKLVKSKRLFFVFEVKKEEFNAYWLVFPLVLNKQLRLIVSYPSQKENKDFFNAHKQEVLKVFRKQIATYCNAVKEDLIYPKFKD